MRLLPAIVCSLLLLSAPAGAQQTNAPPGNSGIDQYLETVPSGEGNRRVERKPGSTQGIAPDTRKELEAQGEDGRMAAELAAAGAPPAGGSGGAGGASGGASGSGAPDAPGADSRLRGEPAGSPVQAVVAVLTGNAAGDAGLGSLLPILLALALASMLAVALLRRRAGS